MSTLTMTVLAAGPVLAAGAGFVVGRWSTRRARATTARALAETAGELRAARCAAARDPLTGLANRAALVAELERRSAGREPFAVLLIDLDGFKAVNDTYGHTAGDVVLVDVAERLAGLVDGAGIAARLGGDEFVLVADSPTGVMSRLLGCDAARVIAAPVDVNGRTVAVTASVGVVQALPGDPAAALLRSADIAMYRAKTGRGRDRVAEFDAALGLAGLEEARPGARLRELTRYGCDLAEVA